MDIAAKCTIRDSETNEIRYDRYEKLSTPVGFNPGAQRRKPKCANHYVSSTCVEIGTNNTSLTERVILLVNRFENKKTP